MNLNTWTGVPRPERVPLFGHYVRLEPFNVASHSASLFTASHATGADDRFRYLPELPPENSQAFQDWFERSAAQIDPLFFAVVDAVSGEARGRQSLMRINEAQGVIEIGNILWGPGLARTQGATEAFFLFADYVFQLGYRRLEWKCNNLNEPSKRAALRFGFTFEGIFRQHMVVKGVNRDTAWFSMLDHEWLKFRPGYVSWLSPDNFDEHGQQRRALQLT